MSKNIPAAPQNDPNLQSVIEHLTRSPRMRVAAFELSRRIAMLDALDRAGFPLTHVEVRVRFQGKQVTTVMGFDEGVELGGGGIARFDPDART